MLQPAPRKKHGAGRWIRRGILLLVVIYAAVALVPCAVPPPAKVRLTRLPCG